MIYYIADLHLHHQNILHLCHRPFETIEEMHQTIKRNWNAVVSEQDDIYIVGDVCFKFNDEMAEYLESLNGRKHLIIGNHDRKFLNRQEFREIFDSIDHYLTIEDEQRKVVLFHYPILEWDGYFKGWYHIYGHIHNSDNFSNQLLNREEFANAFNTGADLIDFTPQTLNQLIRRKNIVDIF